MLVRISRAALQGAFFFGVSWLIGSLWWGIGHDHVIIASLTTAGIFASVMFFVMGFREKKAGVQPQPSLREIMGAIRAIIRQSRNP